MIKDRLAKLTREPTDIRFFRSMPRSVDLVVQPAPASTVAVVAEERAEEQADGELPSKRKVMCCLMAMKVKHDFFGD